MDNAVRDLAEVLIVVAVGGMLWSVVRRLRQGELRAHRCIACERPVSRAYPRCRWCGAEQEWADEPPDGRRGRGVSRRRRRG